MEDNMGQFLLDIGTSSLFCIKHKHIKGGTKESYKIRGK